MDSASNPMETRSILLKPEALVLGGGIVGISIAQSLAGAGIHVTLLEKGDHLGGKALELRTFYNRSEDVRKWIDERTSEIKKNPQYQHPYEGGVETGRWPPRPIRGKDSKWRWDRGDRLAFGDCCGYRVCRPTGKGKRPRGPQKGDRSFRDGRAPLRVSGTFPSTGQGRRSRW